MSESEFLQPLPEAAGVAFAALGQGDVGQAGVLAGNCPRSLAVAGQVNDRQGLAHRQSFRQRP